MMKVEAARREFERKLLEHNNSSHIQMQANQRKQNESMDRRHELVKETDQLNYRMQTQAKHENDWSNKQVEKTRHYKKDLEDLMKQNEDRKMQHHIGISKEEMALNKGLLSSMLGQ